MTSKLARLIEAFNKRAPEEKKLEQRKCWGCDEMFVTNDKNQRYCGKDCKGARKALLAWAQPPVLGKIKYSDYIRSEAWQRKAEAAKKRAKYRCQICNRDRHEVQLEAHHRTYEYLGEERPEDITVLCRDCHELFSKNGQLAKVTK